MGGMKVAKVAVAMVAAAMVAVRGGVETAAAAAAAAALPRAHHRDERRWRARQAAAEPHAIQLRRAEGDVPNQQVLHLAREHRRAAPEALAHPQVVAAHRQREAHPRRRPDAHTIPVDLGGSVGVGEARTRLHDRDVSPRVCRE
jgi:hypothetical protein